MEISMNYLNYIGDKLTEFYKNDEFTNLTLHSGEGEVKAHASICATSNLIRNMLSDEVGPPYNLFLPDTTISDLRTLLDFLYSGKLMANISLLQYLQIESKFCVPSLLDACFYEISRKLSEFYQDPDYAGEFIVMLRNMFVFALKAENITRCGKFFLNLFSFQPMAFSSDECLRALPFSVFEELIKSGDLLMHDIDDVVSFNRLYAKQCMELISVFSRVNDCDIAPLNEAVQKLTRNLESSQNKVIPTLQPSLSTLLYEPSFGSHISWIYEFENMSKASIRTYDSFPPNLWKIAGLRGHVAKNWDNIQPLAGFDVIYENILTSERKEFKWNIKRDTSKYTETLYMVDSGDVIERISIRHGWVIDQITFLTRDNREIGPFGTSPGGGLTTISINDEHICEENSESLEKGKQKLVTVHGFQFVNIRSQGNIFWNQLKICFAFIDSEPLAKKMSFFSPTNFSKWHISI